MIKLEEKGISGIKGLIFDLYNTLIDIRTDEESIKHLRAGQQMADLPRRAHIVRSSERGV